MDAPQRGVIYETENITSLRRSYRIPHPRGELPLEKGAYCRGNCTYFVQSFQNSNSGEAAGPQLSILKSQLYLFYHRKKISADSMTTKMMVAPYIIQMACLIWSAFSGVSGSPMYSRNSGFPS